MLVRKKTGSGQSLYLNLTPLAYEHFPYRAGEIGEAWREVIGKAHNDIGLRPRVEILEAAEMNPGWKLCSGATVIVTASRF